MVSLLTGREFSKGKIRKEKEFKNRKNQKERK